MIEIVYGRSTHSVDVKGHGGGEYGTDIVCASVSALVYTLAENAKRLGGDRRFRRANIYLNSGNAHISIDAVHGMEAVVILIFDAVCTGFELLAEEYPGRISYTRIE